MVTKKSMMNARREFKKWKRENKKASIKQNIKRIKQAIVKGSEAEIGLHTLPSIFVPMPEESVLELKKKINKLRKL